MGGSDGSNARARVERKRRPIFPRCRRCECGSRQGGTAWSTIRTATLSVLDSALPIAVCLPAREVGDAAEAAYGKNENMSRYGNRASIPRVEHATAFALSLGLDQAVDKGTEGFGWRVATEAFVARWQREQVELTAIGYQVCWNKHGDMLVMCWPVAKQIEDATAGAPEGFKVARAAPQRSPARLPPDSAPAY